MVDLLALAHDRGCEAELAAHLAADLEAGRLPDMAACERASRQIPRGCPMCPCTSSRSTAYEALVGIAQIGDAA